MSVALAPSTTPHELLFSNAARRCMDNADQFRRDGRTADAAKADQSARLLWAWSSHARFVGIAGRKGSPNLPNALRFARAVLADR